MTRELLLGVWRKSGQAGRCREGYGEGSGKPCGIRGGGSGLPPVPRCPARGSRGGGRGGAGHPSEWRGVTPPHRLLLPGARQRGGVSGGARRAAVAITAAAARHPVADDISHRERPGLLPPGEGRSMHPAPEKPFHIKPFRHSAHQSPSPDIARRGATNSIVRRE